jgi:hypothetical protein
MSGTLWDERLHFFIYVRSSQAEYVSFHTFSTFVGSLLCAM